MYGCFLPPLGKMKTVCGFLLLLRSHESFYTWSEDFKAHHYHLLLSFPLIPSLHPTLSLSYRAPTSFPLSIQSPLMRLMGISPDDVVSGGKKKENRIIAILHCVPTLPGRSRLMACFCNNFSPKLVKNLPKWLQHQTTFAVLNSDHLLLHLAVSTAVLTEQRG